MLMDWYVEQCNGVWEHGPGIQLMTIDNPGWSFTVNLHGTPLEGLNWEGIAIENGEEDWIICSVEGDQYRGVGDPSKLIKIIQEFLSLLDRG